jgi:hypothetical protein
MIAFAQLTLQCMPATKVGGHGFGLELLVEGVKTASIGTQNGQQRLAEGRHGKNGEARGIVQRKEKSELHPPWSKNSALGLYFRRRTKGSYRPAGVFFQISAHKNSVYIETWHAAVLHVA